MRKRSKILMDVQCFFFNEDCMNSIQKKIEEKDLYFKNDEKDSFGFENEPHVTLLYGFHDDSKPNDILECIKEFEIPEKLVLSHMSLFENDKFDVLKFDLKHNKLFEINKKLSESFEYTTDFPDYYIHSTICYLKPGLGKKYVEKLKNEELEVECKKIVYSDKDNKKTEFLLNVTN